MVSRLGPGPEFDLIRSFLAGTAGTAPGVRVGPGDDCAIIGTMAVTVDLAVEDVHFRRSWLPPRDLGYHAASAALSDLAAVAARPAGVLASLALGPGDEESFGGELMAGLVEAADAVGAVLLGGDLTRSPGPVVLDVVALGEVKEPVLRAGARPGDEVWVTGELGGAAAAVAAWLDGREPDPRARMAFARPVPRVREARWLVERGLPTAMVDLSDGIAGDAGHIAAASGVAVRIRAADLPVAAAAGSTELAAAGGEDYELCFTARPGAVAPYGEAFADAHGIALTRVGTVEEGRGAAVVDAEGRAMAFRAFQHWRGG